MKTRIHDFYVVSHQFNGQGKGFAIGIDSEYAAWILCRVCLFGFGDVLSDWQLETRFPTYYHNLISRTA